MNKSPEVSVGSLHSSPAPAQAWTHYSSKRRVRPSRLDILDRSSGMYQTDLVGLIRLVHIVAAGWLVTSPICRYYEKGSLYDKELASLAFNNFGLLITTWIYAVIYSYTGYALLWLRRRFLWSRVFVKILMHIDTFFLMWSVLTIVRAVSWSVFPSVFLMSVAVIHFMKIHSFVDTSLCVEEQYSDACKELAEPASESATSASSTAAPADEAMLLSRRLRAVAPTAPLAPQDVLTLASFSQFLIVPRLVYEPEWPKSPHGFRWRYFVGKLLLMVSSLASIFLVSANFVNPVMERAHRTSYLHTFAALIVPLFLMDLLFFYVMFECILNMLAELVGYGDRDFYQDWWNSTTWEEFARKWNYPIHEFLLRHIYLPIYTKTGAGGDRPQSARPRKWVASTVTILYSAIIHELFLAATLGFVSWYMIIIMLGQLPLFALSHYHRNTTFGNIFWCFGISLGVPFIAMLYGTDWSAKNYPAS